MHHTTMSHTNKSAGIDLASGLPASSRQITHLPERQDGLEERLGLVRGAGPCNARIDSGGRGCRSDLLRWDDV